MISFCKSLWEMMKIRKQIPDYVEKNVVIKYSKVTAEFPAKALQFKSFQLRYVSLFALCSKMLVI